MLCALACKENMCADPNDPGSTCFACKDDHPKYYRNGGFCFMHCHLEDPTICLECASLPTGCKDCLDVRYTLTTGEP